MHISTKKEFIELWQAGKLGNRLRTWNRPNDIAADGYTGLLGIRSRKAGASWSVTHIPWDKLGASLSKLLFETGLKLEDLYFCEAAPDNRLLIQGEYSNSVGRMGGWGGLTLKYNTDKVRMKTAMSKGFKTVENSAAMIILRCYMSSAAQEQFDELRDRYPNAVIEFGCYEHFLGSEPWNNTLIWEIRDY